MNESACPNCGHRFTPVPPEPPVGTWMRDKFGGVTQRQTDGWGQPGMMPFGKWEAMWEARGPYVECEPWGIGTGDKTP
jgi:hypothetical protein